MIPPLGFAIICKQKHIIRVLLTDSSIGLNKGIHAVRIECCVPEQYCITLSLPLFQMQAPFIIAVKVYDNETARLLLADLGGPVRPWLFFFLLKYVFFITMNNFLDLSSRREHTS